MLGFDGLTVLSVSSKKAFFTSLLATTILFHVTSSAEVNNTKDYVELKAWL